MPFGKGKELIVNIPIDPKGYADVYINNTTGISLAIPGSDNIERLLEAILLAVYTAARPLHGDEPIPCKEMAALAKLLAEAGSKESKIILGWLWDFRRMMIFLPENKFIAWSEEIEKILKARKTMVKELEKNIGRWVHLGIILPQVHHFLSRLRDLK